MLTRADRSKDHVRFPNLVSHPPAVTVTTFKPATFRKRKQRAAEREGRYMRLVEAMIVSGRLDERQALSRKRVAQESDAVLDQWASVWLGK